MPIQNSVEYLEFIKLYFRDPVRAYEKGRSHDQHFRSRACRTAVSDFDMSSNGDVRLCYRMDPIGNVRRTDPEEIWNRRPRCWTRPCRFLDGAAAGDPAVPAAATGTCGPEPAGGESPAPGEGGEPDDGAWVTFNRRD